MGEQKVKVGLEAWRDAERRRDELPFGSSKWQEAEEEVQIAAKVFHAELAQASVRYAEEELQDRNPWTVRLDRVTSRCTNPLSRTRSARGECRSDDREGVG